MKRPELKRLEHEQVEGAVQDVRFSHRVSLSPVFWVFYDGCQEEVRANVLVDGFDSAWAPKPPPPLPDHR
jgi:hypothetical protein